MTRRAAPTLLALTGCRADDLQALLERRARALDAPAASLTVIASGEVIFEGATGTLTLDGGTLATVDTRYRLGSLTKPYTAALVMLLDQDGVWSVDDPIGAWVDGVPNGGVITLRHLLGHTSGLSDYADLDAYWAEADRPWSVDELLALTYADGVTSAPGAVWRYSNAGYLLLGRATERATGQAWEDLVYERLIVPLDLTRTTVGGGDRARGYETDEVTGVLRDCTDHPHSDNSWAAGAIVSTATDVARFGDALLAGGLLDDTHRAWMTERVHADGGAVRYGLGVGIDPWDDGWSIGHQGKSPGYASSWSRRPEVDLTIAVTLSTSDVGGRKIEDDAWRWLGAD